jgi:fumarate hydratase class II
MEDALSEVKRAMQRLYPLAAGGTAVGTGITAPADFGERIAKEIARLTGHPFVTARNKFAAIGSLDPMVSVSAAIRGLAVPLIKIANDVRWLGCGPRAGIHELNLPANEPGSSIMPGKVNPTQEEAVVMVGIQVIGNDTAVGFAGSQGNFELNAMRPIILYNVLHSSTIVADVCDRWREHSLEQITLDRARIDRYVGESLMLVTALSPVIGYDKAAHIAHEAHRQGITLREAALASGDVTGEQFDKVVVPRSMVGNPRRDVGLE